jgi:hypothetical protein
MIRPPLTRDTAKAYRRAFRFGIGPGTGTTPPVQSPLAEPVPRPADGAEDERLVRLDDLPEDVRAYRPEVSR